MKYNGMPMAMWLLFNRSFHKQLSETLFCNPDQADFILRRARSRYKEIIAKLPDFEKDDRFQMNIISCAMLAAFYAYMDPKPDLDDMTAYYNNAMMIEPMKLFCRMSASQKFTPRDIRSMQKTAALKAADRNPYSWNMEFLPYNDGSGYEARFTKCGICTLLRELGMDEIIPAMCALDYAMSEAGGRSVFIRKYTLAGGGPYCDCGYRKR